MGIVSHTVGGYIILFLPTHTHIRVSAIASIGRNRPWGVGRGRETYRKHGLRIRLVRRQVDIENQSVVVAETWETTGKKRSPALVQWPQRSLSLSRPLHAVRKDGEGGGKGQLTSNDPAGAQPPHPEHPPPIAPFHPDDAPAGLPLALLHPRARVPAHAFLPAFDLRGVEFRVRQPGPFRLDGQGGGRDADAEFAVGVRGEGQA